MTFLRDNHFDFNKWISEGVSWLSIDQHEYISTKLMTQFEDNVAKPISAEDPPRVVLEEKDTTWVASVCKIIDEWKAGVSDTDDKEKKTLLIGQSIARNGFQRLLLFQELPRRYPELSVMSDKDPETGLRIVKVSKLTPAEHLAEVNIRREQLKQDIREAFGFGLIFQAIINAKKPVLGHNMFLDLALCFHHFIKPLPEDSDVFCRELHEAIPLIMDSKTVASKHPDLNGVTFSSTALGDIASILLERFPETEKLPNIAIPSDYSRYKLPTRESILAKKKAALEAQSSLTPVSLPKDEATDEAYHEAGFDALQTGAVFLNLAAFYCTGALPSDPVPAPSAPGSDPVVVQPAAIVSRRPISHPLLPTKGPEAGLMNLLNLMHLYGSFNLNGPHRMPTRASMFMLSGLTKEDQSAHILAIFEPIGGMFKLSWIDTSSCVLTFDKVPNEVVDRKILRAPHYALPVHPHWKVQRLADVDASQGRRGAQNKSALSLTSQTAVGFAAGIALSVTAVAGLVFYMNRLRRKAYEG